jgi:oligopeptide transport system ATP-binding protein
VFRAPRHPYTLGLLRSVPRFDVVRQSLDSIPGQPPDLVMPPAGCRFHPRCKFARDDCIEGEFPLRPLAPGRATACIHDAECAAEAAANPVIAGV